MPCVEGEMKEMVCLCELIEGHRHQRAQMRKLRLAERFARSINPRRG